jgi:hypothetical protein
MSATPTSTPTSKQYSYEEIHADRFLKSIEWIKNLPSKHVLEVGAPGPFTATLTKLFPVVRNTDFDLRFGKYWHDVADTFDLVVCMEILEHINEPLHNKSKISDVDAFRFIGVMNLLNGLYSATVAGGFLFLTTPNSASIETIRKAVNGYTPIDYKYHVREYGWKETVQLVTDAGWLIDSVETLDCYDKFSYPAEVIERNTILKKIAVPGQKYGRTTFILAHKPK